MSPRDYKSYMPGVARLLLGNPDVVRGTNWRYGENERLSVELSNGTWAMHGEGGGGVLELVKAHARDWTHGTDLDEWLDRHGIAHNDNAPTPKPTKAKGKLVATYDYKDASGAVVLRVQRYEPKRFSQCRPDGNGGWFYKDIYKAFTHVPYRLPELVANPSASVFIVEGEKDADNLAK